MSDPRVDKLAHVLVTYSLGLRPGDQLFIETTPLAEELNLAVLREALQAGAHVFMQPVQPGSDEVFYKYASPTQLEYVPSVLKFICENFDASLFIIAPQNTRTLSNVDPTRVSRGQKARMGALQALFERAAHGTFKWSLTAFPTAALAQDAEMSLREYEDFVYNAGWLDRPDPAAAWREEEARQQQLVDWLAGKKRVELKGKDIDLQLVIEGRSFVGGGARENFPSGEIFTSPVETSAQGWVRFTYPSIYGGQEVQGIELEFEAGKVVNERAAKGQALLTALLDTDAGSRYLGELGIGTNYSIQRFTRNILFDEKIGGTIHLAVGLGFEEAGGQNKSGIHWDMICDMSESEITVDGELFYKDGKVVAL